MSRRRALQATNRHGETRREAGAGGAASEQVPLHGNPQGVGTPAERRRRVALTTPCGPSATAYGLAASKTQALSSDGCVS